MALQHDAAASTDWSADENVKASDIARHWREQPEPLRQFLHDSIAPA